MSQCYRVQLKASISRTVEAEDSVSYPLELTALLPAPEMAELLAQALVRDGWTADPGGRVYRRTAAGGEEWSLDLDAMTVTARLQRESEVTAEVEASGAGDSNKQAQQVARRQLEVRGESVGSQIAEAGTRTLQREVREALAAGEDARRSALHGLLQQVYAEALKRKAGQLGTVLEVQESTGADGNYELTIRVAT
jgi:hypothetical protein